MPKSGKTIAAYMDATPLFGCTTGKIVYVSMREARHASRSMANWKGKRKPYVCPECGAIHLTSQTRKSRRHRVAERLAERKRKEAQAMTI